MEFLKTIGGKIIGGLVALAVVAGAISWFEMDPQTRHGIVTGTGRILGWLGLVIVLPWATFFLISAVNRVESNLAGAALVFGYSAIEGVLLAWLFGWALNSAMPIVMFSAAVLFAAAYNLLACDWIAEKIG
jgi:FtsH-binding integral membrane protein